MTHHCSKRCDHTGDQDRGKREQPIPNHVLEDHNEAMAYFELLCAYGRGERTRGHA